MPRKTAVAQTGSRCGRWRPIASAVVKRVVAIALLHNSVWKITYNLLILKEHLRRERSLGFGSALECSHRPGECPCIDHPSYTTIDRRATGEKFRFPKLTTRGETASAGPISMTTT